MKGKHTVLLSCAALGAGAVYLLHPGARTGRNAPNRSRRLLRRVRAELQRTVSHPSAIDVRVYLDGTVTLAGPVLMDEADNAISRIQAIGGVSLVDDRLERYADRHRVASAKNVIGSGGGYRAEAEPFGYHRTH
jgi:hypothetical protein